MYYAIVAGSLAHARAVIHWSRLNAETCVPVVYGQELDEPFEHALLVRPTEGMTPALTEWLAGQLVPKVKGKFLTYPDTWKPTDDERPPTESQESPAFAQNPLWL